MTEPIAKPAASLRGVLRLNEPMAKHVSWRTGGVAARAYSPADAADLAVFLATLPGGEPVCFVGLGSNLLVRDGGYRGTVVLMHDPGGAMRLEGDLVFAEAGTASPKVARFAATHGLEGAEFLAGVPGTVGGALAMNAGCYGSETWDVVARVLTVSRAGSLTERKPEEFETGYRRVGLPRAKLGEDEWFLAAWFRFRPGDEKAARRRIKELLARRLATQPLELPNAGSVFRNPPGDHAARLIEAAGLKGREIGGARISEKHANFIVNPKGRARASDIEALIALARTTVHQRFRIDLIPEVRIVGEAA
ncbi:MAG TPA: UDP-N-acetylmuramate dehydrogenase [Burkholderiales bacterium]|nr:UDP-N-acetylmuramate dehydrogenase [Burkholderiales bacterium]